MATYNSSSLHGSGSLGEVLTGAKTFTLTNPKNHLDGYSVAYLTLEGSSFINSNLTADQILSGSFSSFTGGCNEESLTVHEKGWALSVSGNGGAFVFTPPATIPVNSYYIKATGNMELVIS